jgi:urease accessory protein
MLIGNPLSQPIATPAFSQLRPSHPGGASLSKEERFSLFVGTSREDVHHRVVAPLLVTLLLLLPSTASAHTETGAVGGLISGFLHPLTGLDHVVAMVAVGLWGVFLGAPAVWLLPVIFPVVMALGGALGVLRAPLPGVEAGIALSGVILGLMVALAAKPPLRIAGAIVGLFAIFHGHAHGTELPEAANALTYAAGFVIATGLLHLSGIAFGLLARWPWGKVAVRAGGAVTAAVGCAFLFHLL